ncbi:molybdenum ABC transporter ATP-binding protein [Jannaschia rubra]|uniref:Sulfate/thiosulfate import ATP-binding protein CysA n=1 Tax=Jannaschia rubra TaxID=282197 RepID=A0A0M6XRL4_9RHOB|nr:molybdenum ABC transporter ATP-binding protein [Jannaschia rubra]CTQ33362.1 Sulfate/thiosulfate import ATP-binding protein CysA [Jannaschia rubra]SFG00002.1 molybdate transport system ATP-binding protein [Jannaschia rubra]
MSLSVALRHRLPAFDLDVAFDAPPGVTALFGRSGSGKTTVVNAVAGLLRPDAGHVAVNGRTLFDSSARRWLPPHRRRIGYVFQEGRLFPHLTVRGNLLYGHRFAGDRRAGAGLDRVVGMLGIAPLLARRPADLSGGEKQRVAIGRALLSAPELLLMDEPLAALDEARKAEILPYLERLRDGTDIPILYVSHAVAEIARLATTIVVLDDGRVLRQGPAAEVLGDPALAPALGVRGAGAILSARVVAHHNDGLTELSVEGGRLFLPRIGSPAGAAIRVRIAAQDVMLSRGRPDAISALNILEGTVREVRAGDGPGAMVVVAIGSQTVLARVTRRSCAALGLAPGIPCHAIMKSVAVAPGDIGTGARDAAG